MPLMRAVFAASDIFAHEWPFEEIEFGMPTVTDIEVNALVRNGFLDVTLYGRGQNRKNRLIVAIQKAVGGCIRVNGRARRVLCSLSWGEIKIADLSIALR